MGKWAVNTRSGQSEPVVRKRQQASSRPMGTVDPEKDNNYRTGGLGKSNYKRHLQGLKSL
jgi:hypothetical protein